MNLFRQPLTIFLSCFVLLYCAAEVGNKLRQRLGPVKEGQRGDFDVVLSATLTLLGLLIAFTFSMAINRYDERKAYEEAEANAIGTEYLRADLLPELDANRVRVLLKAYVEQRVLFYTTRDRARLDAIGSDTSKIQDSLWSSVRPRPETPITPVTGLVIAGMNDVLNSQGYTQASWWNRIPRAAWILMGTIATLCNLLIGVRASQLKTRRGLLLILPLILSVAFLLIADIDSPRGGYIHVRPQNLLALSATMH